MSIHSLRRTGSCRSQKTRVGCSIFRPSVQQQEGRAVSRLGDMHPEAARIDEAVLDLDHGRYAAANRSGRKE
jgi:hypothetical protein